MTTPESIQEAYLTQHQRQRIVEAAQALFSQRGLAAVALADVAGYLGLRERVVLDWFPGGKAELVQAAVEAFTARVQLEMQQQKARSTSAVAELLALRTWVSQEMSQVHELFFRDMETHYPASWHYWQHRSREALLHRVRENLTWGIAQELYRDTLDIDFLARLWLQQLQGLDSAAAAGLAPAEVHATLLEHFILGIATPAGTYVVRRLQEAPP